MIPFENKGVIGHTFINLGPEITTAILCTLERGWAIARARPEISRKAKEVVITECLRDGMRKALTTKRFPWHKTMIVAPGTESRSRPGLTIPDGRTDIPIFVIQIFLRSGEHDPHAIIECKRIAAGDSLLVREYVVQGVDRFCSGKYAASHDKGFMVAYVLSGTPISAVKSINAYLNRHARKSESLAKSGFRKGAYASRHPRKTPNWGIELQHTMLVVRPLAQAHKDVCSRTTLSRNRTARK
jgi:hypothetical protein